MYACKNSKPQGLEEYVRLESSEAGRTEWAAGAGHAPVVGTLLHWGSSPEARRALSSQFGTGSTGTLARQVSSLFLSPACRPAGRRRPRRHAPPPRCTRGPPRGGGRDGARGRARSPGDVFWRRDERFCRVQGKLNDSML